MAAHSDDGAESSVSSKEQLKQQLRPKSSNNLGDAPALVSSPGSRSAARPQLSITNALLPRPSSTPTGGSVQAASPEQHPAFSVTLSLPEQSPMVKAGDGPQAPSSSPASEAGARRLGLPVVDQSRNVRAHSHSVAGGMLTDRCISVAVYAVASLSQYPLFGLRMKRRFDRRDPDKTVFRLSVCIRRGGRHDPGGCCIHL